MSNKQYYNSYGQKIKNPDAYAKTGAPMYKNFVTSNGNKVKKPNNF